MRAETSPGHTVVLTDLIEVPGGRFMMGSAAGRPDERPAHAVEVSVFAVARLPVRNREYARFIAAGHASPRFWADERYNHSDQPVVGVTWADAVAYCEWLSGETGRRCRLPTEAEWEYAALGGMVGRLYPWGDDIPEVAPGTLISGAPMDRPAPAGSGPENGFGIRDLGWNVHEWCSDWYNATYYAVAPIVNPQGPPAGTRRASRGGAWRHQIKISRCAARSSIPPRLEYADYGFRVFAEVR
ncbi:MAG: formylglycine-generating enzyme family protein [Dehalococcoidia bacterium]